MPSFSLGKIFEGPAFGVLNEFIAEKRNVGGFALPSRYELKIIPPTGTRGTEPGINVNLASILMPQESKEKTVQKTAMRCESIEFPGRNLDTTADVNIYGPERNIVSGYSFADINATFQCGTEMKEKKFFETWQKLAFNSQLWNIEYYDTYVGALQIYQLDTNDVRRYGCEVVDCFPKTIAAVSGNASPSTEVQKIQVTFAYRYWYNMKTDESGKALPDRLRELVGEGVEREIRSKIPRVLSRL